MTQASKHGPAQRGPCVASVRQVWRFQEFLLICGFRLDGRRDGGYGKNGVLSLYESWHAAEPGKGYDAKAAEWRAKLPKADEVEPAKR